MNDMYPALSMEQAKKFQFPLSSYLFGHRMRPNQTNIEYLIEFLQVMMAEKNTGIASEGTEWKKEYFPVFSEKSDVAIKYRPRTCIGLKRFIFFPHSKPEGKAIVDQKAYEACVTALRDKVKGGEEEKKRAISVLQDLFFGFNATTQSRSWFDMNMLPVCPEVVLPEGMGVKTERKKIEFDLNDARVDDDFSYTRYTYMCRGGEIYYLHLLDGVNRCDPKLRASIDFGFKRLICDSYPQFSKLSGFIEKNWDNYMMVDCKHQTEKQLTAIPAAYSARSKYAAQEIDRLLKNNIHPFEKIQILADGILLQLLRVMYSVASEQIRGDKAIWVLDLCSKNAEMRKLSVASFEENEKDIISYVYDGYEKYKSYLRSKTTNENENERFIVKEAQDNSYRLYRKLGKEIGLVIPRKGANMRFSLSERIVKFLVLSLIEPGQKITLDYFLDLIYEHFGIVIDSRTYKVEQNKGRLKELSDYSVLNENKKGMVELLKACGFLRDLSDATAIVENPFENEGVRA